MEVIRKRRSIRRFKPDSVPEDLIKKIIEAAVWAPSACNIQGWRFIIVDDQKIKEKIVDDGGAVIIKNAPVGILVIYDNQTKNIEYQDHIQSAAAAIQNMLLSAACLGLGASWICDLPPMGKLRKIFKIPPTFSPIAYVLLGYKEREPIEIARLHPLEKLINYNVFSSEFPQENKNTARLFLYRIARKFYFSLPSKFKKRFLNKFVDKKFVKKFDN